MNARSCVRLKTPWPCWKREASTSWISDINMGGISGQQTIDFAIEAMRAGAFDYITKPLDGVLLLIAKIGP